MGGRERKGAFGGRGIPPVHFPMSHMPTECSNVLKIELKPSLSNNNSNWGGVAQLVERQSVDSWAMMHDVAQLRIRTRRKPRKRLARCCGLTPCK